jgi:hypothetical protein
MYNIGIVGSKDYVFEMKVGNFVKKIYDQFGNTATILSGGNEKGAEKWAKKYALEFGLPFKEFNPAYTGYRMYSALPEEYYKKGFHPSHFYDRYRILLNSVDRLVIFAQESSKLEPDLEYIHKRAVKQQVPCIIIK